MIKQHKSKNNYKQMNPPSNPPGLKSVNIIGFMWYTLEMTRFLLRITLVRMQHPKGETEIKKSEQLQDRSTFCTKTSNLLQFHNVRYHTNTYLSYSFYEAKIPWWWWCSMDLVFISWRWWCIGSWKGKELFGSCTFFLLCLKSLMWALFKSLFCHIFL